MKFISLGLCSINLLYPSLIPIFYLARMITNKQIIAQTSEQIPFFSTVLVHWGQLLSGLVCLIISFILRRDLKAEANLTPEQREKKKQLITYLVKKEKKRSLYVYFIVLMIVMLDGISITSQALLTFYMQGEQLAIMMKVFQLYTTSFLSKASLRISFYRHQGLAIALITLGTLPIIYSFFNSNLGDYELTVSFFFCLLVVNAFGISFYCIGQKHLFDKEYFSLTEMLLMEGATGFVLNCLFILFTSIPCNSPGWLCKMMFIIPKAKNIIDWVFGSGERVGFVILSVLLSGILNVCYALTNKIISPTHRAITDCFCFVLVYIYQFCLNPWDFGTPTMLVVQWLANLALILGNMIYCEYIILHFCGLEKNTKKKIAQRSNDEIKQCIEFYRFEGDENIDLVFNNEN